MFRWGTGFDFLNDGAAQAQLSRLSWYDFPAGPAPASLTISPSGRFSGSKALRLGAGINSNSRVTKLINGADFSEFYVGAAAFIQSASLDVILPAIGVSYNSTTKLQVQFDNFGQVKLYDGRGNGGAGYEPAGTLLATSSSLSYQNDSWLFVEIGGLLSLTTSGWCTVRINTVPVIELVDTATSSVDPICNGMKLTNNGIPGAGFSSDGPFWDDIYVNDNQGSKNNSFNGNTRVQVLLPAGVGDSTQWTPEPNTDPNWEAASNTLVDNTSYVYSSTPGDSDLYEVTPLLNSPEIFAVSVLGAYLQDDATQRSVKNLIKSGTTTEEGAEYFTNSTYSFTQPDIYEDDPDTATTWTYTDVNLIQIGPKLES